MIRVPPSLSSKYAEAHDQALWETFCATFSATDLAGRALARKIATLPGRKAGLGLRSAKRTAPCAYWASWVSTLHVMSAQTPDLADAVVWQLGSE